MSSKPLPTNMMMLERMFGACEDRFDYVCRAMQRDAERCELLRKGVAGEINVDHFEKRRIELEVASNAAIDPGVPTVEFLAPYFDENLFRVARHKMSFGEGAASEAHTLKHLNVCLPMLIAAYDAIVLGHLARLDCLRDLRERLQAAIEGGDLPQWNPETNELWYNGVVVRRVRGKSIAGNVRLLLAEFQRLDWQKRIPAPPNFADQAVRETVRTLNRGLSSIRFHSDDGGKFLIWQTLRSTTRASHTHHT